MSPAARYTLDADHVDALTALYKETWFGEEWERETVEDLLAGTDELVALVDDGGDLLAFAHVLTDYTTVAFVRDVVVRQDVRRQGLGRRLMAELAAHPELGDVDSLSVTCPERLAGFYERCGFEPREDGAVLVRDCDD